MAARQQWTRLQNRGNAGLDRVPRRSPEQINAGQLAFWNGPGGHTWVARQEHTDITLAPVTEASLAFAASHTGERVPDIGCGCGATTLEFARPECTTLLSGVKRTSQSVAWGLAGLGCSMILLWLRGQQLGTLRWNERKRPIFHRNS